MIKVIGILFIFCSTTFGQLPTNEKDVPSYLQDISVTVKTNRGTGSGTIIKKDHQTFILTAAHVVESARKEREIVKDGEKKTLVEFDDVEIMQLHFEGDRIVGQTIMKCEVIHYSNADHYDDVAVLRVRQSDYGTKSAVFGPKDASPSLGDEARHVGSFLGEDGANSYSEGNVSQIGRIINGKRFNQIAIVAFPGSSGGAVTFKSGSYMGMLTMGMQINFVPLSGFSYITPLSRLYEWAERTNFTWLFNNDPVPELKKLTLEDL